MTRRFSFLVAITLALVAVCSSAATGQEDDVGAARLHYKLGTRAFELGHYDEAVREYEAAYEAKDDPALLFNIAQAYRLKGDRLAALRAYKSYLHRVPNAENGDEVRGRITELQRAIDDENRMAKPPAPAEPAAPPATALPQPATAAPPVKSRQDAPARPIYKRWYFWTPIAIVVAGGVATALVLTLVHRSDGFNPTIADVGPGAQSALGIRF